LDVLRPLIHKKILENELEGFGIRLNKQPPNIHFKRKEKGGINLQVMVNRFTYFLFIQIIRGFIFKKLNISLKIVI
jgi:ribosome-interacting GTPase 1